MNTIEIEPSSTSVWFKLKSNIIKVF